MAGENKIFCPLCGGERENKLFCLLCGGEMEILCFDDTSYFACVNSLRKFGNNLVVAFHRLSLVEASDLVQKTRTADEIKKAMAERTEELKEQFADLVALS